MVYQVYWARLSSCYKLFRGRKYGLFISQNVDVRWNFLYHGIPCLQITEKVLFWTFQRCKIRSFLIQDVDGKIFSWNFWAFHMFQDLRNIVFGAVAKKRLWRNYQIQGFGPGQEASFGLMHGSSYSTFLNKIVNQIYHAIFLSKQMAITESKFISINIDNPCLFLFTIPWLLAI